MSHTCNDNNFTLRICKFAYIFMKMTNTTYTSFSSKLGVNLYMHISTQHKYFFEKLMRKSIDFARHVYMHVRMYATIHEWITIFVVIKCS